MAYLTRGFLVLAIAVTPAIAVDVEAELAAMLAARPEADTNGDGVLTEDEAADYMVRVRRKGRVNTGPGIRNRALIDAYEEGEHGRLLYRLMRPLEVEPDERYPLVVSLHGSGGTGDDNLSNLRVWNGYMARQSWREKYPSYVLVPQHRGGEIWGPKPDVPEAATLYVRDSFPDLLDLIDGMLAELPIDPDRIYVLGSSGGGVGTWNLLAAKPEMFAAAIPVCAARPVRHAERLTGIPIWIFHGGADPLAPVKSSRGSFRALKDLGGNVKYTELDGVGHNSWIQAFQYRGDDEAKGYITHYGSAANDRTADVWGWLFSKRRERN